MRFSAQRQADWDLTELGLDPLYEPRWVQSGKAEVVRIGRGSPLVMVPGLAGGWRLLLPLARHLAQRHKVYLVGLRSDRGVAGSSSASESPYDHAMVLSHTLESLGLERSVVCGVSFGGAVALELAIHCPRLVGGLVLIGTEARFEGGLGAAIARRVLERFPLPPNNRFVNQFFNLLHGRRPVPGPLPQFVVDRCWETDQGVMARRLQALESFDVLEDLPAIQSPTLVLAGTRDVIVPETHQRAMSRRIPGSTYRTLEGAGHIGFLTHRQEVGRQIGSWMRKELAVAH